MLNEESKSERVSADVSTFEQQPFDQMAVKEDAFVSHVKSIVIDPLQQQKVVMQHMLAMQKLAVAEEVKAFVNSGKALCLTMCTPEEIYHRSEVEMGSISNFEQTRQGENFNNLAIKRFQRSAADKEVNQPGNIRPPPILYQVICFLRDAIAD